MANPLSDKILASASKIAGLSVALRRRLHQIPETAWEEKKTSATLKNFLKTHGIPFRSVAKTGIVGEIRSGKGKCVAIRTDIDALPITEETDYAFKSIHPGRMHACGHDIHMATVSTAALLLMQMRSEFAGTVKLLYQPSEESPPGGAIAMVKAGVLKHPQVDMIFGLHVWPTINVGQIGIKEGALCAGVLDFDVEILGKGGHGAYPQDTIDPIVCAAQVVSSLQTIVSRHINPFEPAVVTIGKIDGGATRNVIPPICRLSGTARAQSTEMLKQLQIEIEKIVLNIAKGHGCKAKFTYLKGYPPLTNVPAANKYLSGACLDLYGKRALVSPPHPSMGGEDFAHFLGHVPGAMFLLGMRNPKIGAIHGLHHPKFKADEDAITIGAAVLTKAVIDFLND
ncbi:MAG: amidohydrolase [Candidatus Zixiibacteriota bacterium]|nr:MAG: amidohydrolase [candidate division Zixibacteria bacterium]